MLGDARQVINQLMLLVWYCMDVEQERYGLLILDFCALKAAHEYFNPRWVNIVGSAPFVVNRSIKVTPNIQD
jgi:hypothetical protein